ncbi:F-box domain-containing protein [Trichophyton interdigitale]|uniref:F-box domain-containing protein n=1 Tax=Trichophyton interdigitale TaxID=101480 RepID=A0A9P4YLG5_9EURO|nr:F-box domain-containing protein [Trichophyton interdigitale]KAF3899105.1 F-box domain-containing protein [Trichophyton interdigitale]KAG8211738.1 F-box domain-containing protein [Trichophyton interdigitale]
MELALTTLPLEIRILIFSYLPNSTIKNLRLTCSSIKNATRLGLDRVFLSIQKRDIEVFRNIASHETMRLQVKEIIWDDGSFSQSPLEDVVERDGEYLGQVSGLPYEKVPAERCQGSSPKYCPKWFSRECHENLSGFVAGEYDHSLAAELMERVMELHELLPPWESWERYKEYLKDQLEVLDSEADVEALKFGLERFPALRKITIIPTAHRKLFSPLYPTPNIRSLPCMFNYPIPQPWPISDEETFPVNATPWTEDAQEFLKDRWRGFRVVTRCLAEQAGKHQVTDLVIDPGNLKTGINYNIFNAPCRELSNFTTMLEQPGFKRLDLTLFVGGKEDLVWTPFKDSHYHSTFSKCPDLEHITFGTDRGFYATEELSMDHFTSLLSLFPVQKWSKLRHFGLSSFPVVQSDIINLLDAMPLTLRTVELTGLIFINDGENYNSLLTAMRDTLDWKERAVEDRPRVAFWTNTSNMLHAYMEQTVSSYLYGDGENPMRVGPGRRMYFSG